MNSKNICLAVDIGGTFTDVVVYYVDAGEPKLRWTKTSSTPDCPVKGILEAVDKGLSRIGAAGSDVSQFLHATTTGTNAILERKGAKLGILITEGFEDVLEIGRQRRSQLYDIFLRPETPGFLAPRRRRLGVRERVSYDGRVLLDLEEGQLTEQVKKLISDGVESIAVCFLFSFSNPSHEIRTRKILKAICPQTAVSLSHEINPVFREYERLCVTAFDAYLRPVMETYLTQLVDSLKKAGFRGTVQTMKSRGGLESATGALRRPVTTMLSGPAAGVIGARFIAQKAGISNVITLDMGGTSADVSVVREGKPLTTTNGKIESFPLSIPMVDVHTIGTGGGSIAWLDGANGLRVGPHSAGSDPGPACYANGGNEPTVTDASVVLGYLNPEGFVGGAYSLDVDASRRVLERIAEPLGMSVTKLALGIHRIINAQMADAIRLMSIKRGYDIRQFTLMAFGGAGPVNAAAVASDLGISQCLIPRTAGVLSALGLLVSNVEHDNATTYPIQLSDLDVSAANKIMEQLRSLGFNQMAEDGYLKHEVSVSFFADMRYVGQSSELEVSLTFPIEAKDIEKIRQDFEREHARVYGYAPPNTPIEFVNFRAVHTHQPALQVFEALCKRNEIAGWDKGQSSAHSYRQCMFLEGEFCTPVYRRADLSRSFEIEGPAVVEQEDTTIVIYPKYGCHLDRLGNMIIRQREK